MAVTGGIATGKSTAVTLLAEALDAPCCSCDVIVRELLETAGVVSWIQDRFPEVIGGAGEVDRKRLGERVFRKEGDRLALEGFLHPLVLEEIGRWRAARENRTRFGIVEVPLLYEVDFPLKRDVDIVVACSERKQIERLAGREGLSVQQRGRIAAQWPLPEKVARAPVVVWNEGSLGILSRLVALAAGRIQQMTS